MATSALTITLPEPLKQYVDKRVEYGEFGTPGAYLRSLIRQDRDRRVAALKQVLIEALDSGVVAISQEELMSENFIEILRTRNS